MSESSQPKAQFYDQYWDHDYVPPYLDALFPTFERLGIQPGAKVLDIGCGNGVLGEFLIRRYDCQMYGTEVSPVALKAAVARGYAVEAVQPDAFGAFRRPFPDVQFDVVVLSAILEHVFDPEALLALAFSALKDGGYLVALTPNVTWFLNRILFALDIWEHPLLGGTPGHIRFLNRHMLESLLTDAGFQNLDWSYSPMAALPPGQDLFVRNHRVPFLRRLVGRRARRHPSLWAENLIVLGRKPISNPDTAQWAQLKPPDRVEGLKVLHIAATPSGATWMCNIVRDLRSRGYDAYAMISPGQGDLTPKLERADVPYYVGDLDVFNALDLVGIARKIFKLARFLREHRFDIVHYHLFTSVILGRAASYIADVPLRFSMITGPYYLEAPAPREIDRRTLWMDTKVIASCEFTRELYLKMGVPAKKLERIFYGPDPSHFDPALADPQKLRREFGIPAEDPIVSMVAYFYGRLPAGPWTPPHLQGRAGKGHETLLEAAQLVLEQNPRVKFLLVGKGWEAAGVQYEQEMKELAKEMGLDHAVIFAGWRPDVPDVLASSDVTVQCSRSENLGGTIEALLMACPTVATEVGGMVDSVRHEKTGLLVPVDDAPRLAGAILRLLDNPQWARQLGQNGRELMLREFALTKTVDDIDQLYQVSAHSILKNKGRVSFSPSTLYYRIHLSVVRVLVLALYWAGCFLSRDVPSLISRFIDDIVQAARNIRVDPKESSKRLGGALADLAPCLLAFAALVYWLPVPWQGILLAVGILTLIVVRVLYAGPTMTLIRLLTKRVFDIFVAIVVAAVTLPVWLVVALAIRRDSPGPILSRQRRAGRFGQPFEMLRFRMITSQAARIESAATAGVDDPSVTPLGRILHRLHLDKLPHLINVVRGDMSLVGPRPVSPQEAEHYSPDQRRRLDVKPGMVGWGSIHGRGRLPGAEGMQLDLWYVEHWSFWVDSYILLKEFLSLIGHKGTAAKNRVENSY